MHVMVNASFPKVTRVRVDWTRTIGSTSVIDEKALNYLIGEHYKHFVHLFQHPCGSMLYGMHKRVR